MLRVTELVNRIWSYSPLDFEKWLDEVNAERPNKKPLTPEQIEKWSSKFGTAMHKWCLEGKAPKNPTKNMYLCYNYWIKFKEDTGIKFLTTERKVMYEELYHGTLDAIVEWDGLIVLLDLKFWKCWYWVFLKEKIPTELKMNSTKLAKTNFQTYCYQQAQHDYEIDARCVVAIHPGGLQYKIFSRSPKVKFDEQISILKQKTANDF